jgi:hypothetical protein
MLCHHYIWQCPLSMVYFMYTLFQELSVFPASDFFYTVKPVLNGPYIKRNFVLNGNIFRSRDYHSIPWLNGNLASAEKCSGPLRFRLRQVLLYQGVQCPVTQWRVTGLIPTIAINLWSQYNTNQSHEDVSKANFQNIIYIKYNSMDNVQQPCDVMHQPLLQTFKELIQNICHYPGL